MDAVCHPQTGTILMSPTRDERFLFQRKRFPLDISDSGDMGTVEVAERYGLTVNICVLSGSLFCFLSMSPNTGIWALYYEQKMERFFSRESLEPKKKKKKSCSWSLGARPSLTMQPGRLPLTQTSLQALPVLQVEKDAWTLPPTT